MIFWIFFHLLVFSLIYVDLTCLQKKKISALKVSLYWIGLALIFACCIGLFLNWKQALTFCTAYVVEKSLSLDNLFVFIALFSFFKVSIKNQRKVLFWGILGALFFRILFILLGITLINHFTWMFTFFGLLLVISSVFMFFQNKKIKIQDSWIMKIATKILPLAPKDLEKKQEGQFFIRKDKKQKIYCTSLFLCLLFIETSDLLFAIDSIPAVLAITTDPFLAYTSNVFAILGLRALYFFLVAMKDKLAYLDKGIAVILLLIGCKMVLEPFVQIPSFVFLGLVAAIFFILFMAQKKLGKKQ